MDYANQKDIQTVKIDGLLTGGVFEGVGGLSAGASSRLLVDYPDKTRSEILDLLFMPGFGASLQHFKIEAGSDVNSTDGSELMNIPAGYYKEILARGKRCYVGEDGVWQRNGRGTMLSAAWWASTVNRNYIDYGCTKTLIWPAISAFYDSLHISRGGLINAAQPWSGFYEVFPILWTTAHTTQFAKPGWVYIGGNGCGILDGGGSYVTLMDQDSGDYSIIIETYGAQEGQTFHFETTRLKNAPVKIWRTHGETAGTWFVKHNEIYPINGNFTITVGKNSVVTVTTNDSLVKKGGYLVPERSPFPFPYTEDFEEYTENETPRYFSGQHGYFEVCQADDAPRGKKKALRQKLAVAHFSMAPPISGILTMRA